VSRENGARNIVFHNQNEGEYQLKTTKVKMRSGGHAKSKERGARVLLSNVGGRKNQSPVQSADQYRAPVGGGKGKKAGAEVSQKQSFSSKLAE